MRNTYPFIALLMLAVFSLQLTPAIADGGQWKEDDVLVEHTPEVAETPAVVNIITAPAKIFKSKEGKSESIFNKLPGTDFVKKSSAKESRRYMDTPVLVMLIGGGTFLLGLIFLIIGAITFSGGGTGVLAVVGYLMMVFGSLAVSAGFIWWLVTR